MNAERHRKTEKDARTEGVGPDPYVLSTPPEQSNSRASIPLMTMMSSLCITQTWLGSETTSSHPVL